jgi:hypothetical protein
MARSTKPKPIPTQPESGSAVANGPPSEVLTLAETAAYLRLPETEVVGLIHSQSLPGRYLVGEWRFLKAAIQQWLAAGSPTPQSRKAAQLAAAGAFRDDPDLIRICEEAYRQRGRPITEDGSYNVLHGLEPE